MFCEHCGQKISDNAKFCESCGAPILQDPSSTKTSNGILGFIQTHKTFSIICGVVFFALCVVCIVLSSIKPKIDPFDYVYIGLSGFDSRGRCVVSFDPKDELSLFMLDVTESEVNRMSFEEKDKLLSSIYIIDSAIDVDFETSTNSFLSNGDTITVRITIDQEAIKEFNGRFAQDTYEKKYIVGKDTQALSEPLRIDLLEITEGLIRFSGFNHVGKLHIDQFKETFKLDSSIKDICAVEVSNESSVNDDNGTRVQFKLKDSNGDILQSMSAYIEATSCDGLSNGDEIILSTSGHDSLASYGVIIEENEITLTVSNLEDPMSFDVLGTLEPIFSGINGNGELNWNYGTKKYDLPRSLGWITSSTVTVKEAQYSSSPKIELFFSGEGRDSPTYSFEVKCDKYEKLSNGDIITLSFRNRFNNDQENIEAIGNEYGIFILSETSVEVTGLTEPVQIDLLGNLKYSYELYDGKWDIVFSDEPYEVVFDYPILGYNSATIFLESGPRYYAYRYYFNITYHVNPGETNPETDATIKVRLRINDWRGVSNGDVLSLKVDSVDYLAKCGIAPTQTEMTITVEGI